MTHVVELLRQGRAKDAVTFARRQVSDAPRDSEAYASLAHALMVKRDYQEAVEAVSRAIDFAPHDPALHFLRCRANYAREQFDSALADALRAVEESERAQDHFYVDSCRLVEASCYCKLGQQQAAQEVLSRLDDDVKVKAGKFLLTRESVLQEAYATSVHRSRGEPMGM